MKHARDNNLRIILTENNIVFEKVKQPVIKRLAIIARNIFYFINETRIK
jgi:hypothetical protein